MVQRKDVFEPGELPRNDNEDSNHISFEERMEDDDFAIYYRSGFRTTLFGLSGTSTNIGRRDHIITEEGETLCDNRASVYTSDAKPFSEVTDWEWRFITTRGSNLCLNCWKIADKYDLFPDDVPGEVPEFPCPQCGEEVHAIKGIGYSVGVPTVVHDDGRHHEFDSEIYDEWRRGEAPDDQQH